MLSSHERSLVDLGRALQALKYRFVTVTPETHRHMLQRQHASPATSLRDVFGWNRSFSPACLPDHIFNIMVQGDLLRESDGQLFSKVRFSSLSDALYVHSAFPTDSPNAIFFGPDTYRFVNLLKHRAQSARHVVDIGCGTGAGGLSLRDKVQIITLTDINPQALRWAVVNAHLANTQDSVRLWQGSLLEGLVQDYDLVIANPPYLVDAAARVYRHGGGLYGEDIAVQIVKQALTFLPPGGQLLLYTGTAMRQSTGEDVFFAAVKPHLEAANVLFTYSEWDPDVFSEELNAPAYRDIERLAVVFLDVRRPA